MVCRTVGGSGDSPVAGQPVKIEILIIKIKDYGKLFSTLFRKKSPEDLSSMAFFSPPGSAIRGRDGEKSFFSLILQPNLQKDNYLLEKYAIKIEAV